MGLRVNLGAGDDIRPGWLNIDNGEHYGALLEEEDGGAYWRWSAVSGGWFGDMRYLDDVTRGVSLSDRCAELVLLNHSLHYVTADDADLVLDHCVRILAPGGCLVIVEPDILGVLQDASLAPWYDKPGERARFVCDLISDEDEPTNDGKILRWASWYGERRSLWSWHSLADRLVRRGLHVMSDRGDYDHWSGNRGPESFVVVASKS